MPPTSQWGRHGCHHNCKLQQRINWSWVAFSIPFLTVIRPFLHNSSAFFRRRNQLTKKGCSFFSYSIIWPNISSQPAANLHCQAFCKKEYFSGAPWVNWKSWWNSQDQGLSWNGTLSSRAIVPFQNVLKLLCGFALVDKQFAFPIFLTVDSNYMTMKESLRGRNGEFPVSLHSWTKEKTKKFHQCRNTRTVIKGKKVLFVAKGIFILLNFLLTTASSDNGLLRDWVSIWQKFG